MLSLAMSPRRVKPTVVSALLVTTVPLGTCLSVLRVSTLLWVHLSVRLVRSVTHVPSPSSHPHCVHQASILVGVLEQHSAVTAPQGSTVLA